MNPAKQADRPQKSQQEKWPQKLNKALIAIGVIAFGLIITDRIIEMFSADDLPAMQAELAPGAQAFSAALSVDNDAKSKLAGLEQTLPIVKEPAATAAVAIKSDETPSMTDTLSMPTIDLQKVFGSRVVFVSASEPVYVITADDRRFDVGSEIDSQTTLAGVTAQELILEHAGGLAVISLPDPVVQ